MKRQTCSVRITLAALVVVCLALSQATIAQSQKCYAGTDLGTLGGAFSGGLGINNKGHVIGFSETSEVDPNTGFPLFHAFLWEDGVMTDLSATLGGNNIVALDINNKNQVVGSSDIQIPHAFLWDKGVLTDLGTLGGNISFAADNNDKGQVIGFSETGDVDPNTGFPFIHAFLWEDGVMTDLGTLGGKNSFGQQNGINNRGQVVGASFLASDTTLHAFLWEDGIMTDLNSLIPADSGWELISANGINERGQIVGEARINAERHAFLLTPTRCNSNQVNGGPTLLTKKQGNSISAPSPATMYRGLRGEAGIRGAVPGCWKSR